MILAGDVGGTKTALALFEVSGDGLALVREATLSSPAFRSLEAAVDCFLGAGPRPAIVTACVGVAGPVVDGRCLTTNLPWEIDERALVDAIPAGRVRLLNDLEACAHGVLGLPGEALPALQPGRPRAGHLALVAAGTGLGEALVVTEGERRTVIASEGGHADFAPRGELEEDLLRFLRKDLGHVSYERVLSGPGLFNIYRFLRAAGVAEESPALTARLRTEDAGRVITALGLTGTEPLCARALDVFISIYGAEAGNLALKVMALGGVILAGGIAPRILPRLAAGGFVAAFRDKGRLAPLMETIPVHVCLDPRAPLLGAARVALSLL